MKRKRDKPSAHILQFPEIPKGAPTPWDGLAEYERAIRDGDLHVMLQQALDAGGRWAWMCEFNTWMAHRLASKEKGES